MSSHHSRVKPKQSSFKLYIELPLDSRRLCLEGLTTQTDIKTIKLRLDEDSGLLPELYYLSYLDAAPLEDDSCLGNHDVVAGATLRLCPWRLWTDLLRAIYLGDSKECLACSLNIAGDSVWSRHCAWVALYVASSRGQHLLVAKLLEHTSLAINTQTSSGRTALHAAARVGHWKTLCVLIDNGADVRIKDNDNKTAFDLARHYGHKKCENSLNFCLWNLQKHQITGERRFDYDARKSRRTATREAHQYADSSLVLGLNGTQGQRYVVHTPNPVTVRDVQVFERYSLATRKTEGVDDGNEKLADVAEGQRLDFNYGWFDPLRSQQLIPPTHDVLAYSDPSSCHLRPKSILNPGGYTVRNSQPRVKFKSNPSGGGGAADS